MITFRRVVVPYQWDVFISYRRAPPVGTWLKMYFRELFETWLKDALPDVQIFIDDRIESGEWPDQIKEALESSKVLVPIWTPAYFQSPWCMYEWRSFAQTREREAILPICFNACHTIPDAARVQQMTDFCEYAYTAESFRQSARYMGFEDRIKEFAGKVIRIASRIDGAPPVPPPIAPPVIPPPPEINLAGTRT